MNNSYTPGTSSAPPPPPPFYVKPPKKNHTWLWVTAIIALVAVLFISFIVFIALLAGGDGDTDVNQYVEPTDDFIAVLYIEGTIAQSSEVSLFNSTVSSYNHAYVLSTIEQLKYSDTNKGIMLYIDSPGGEVYAVDEVYLALMDYKKTTGRPVYAYCASYAASGGYYLAVTADHISSNRMGVLGSIGVTYGVHYDISGLLEKYGITATAITSGDNKAMGDISQPLTEEQLEIFRSQIDEYYEIFVDIVDAGRSEMNREEVYACADGRTFTAKQALERGLIDAISDYGTACETMIEDCKLDENISFVDYFYTYTMSYDELMNLFGQSITPESGSVIDPFDLSLLARSRYSPRGPLVYYSGK